MDRRTRAGKFWKAVEAELVAHVGTPTAPQRLLIQSATLKATRLALMSDALLQGEDIHAESSQDKALAWLNSLRHDLQALGLERRTALTPTLADYLEAKDEAA